MSLSATSGNSRVDRAGSAAVPANNRSAVTNGALGIDQRTRTGRRWRDIYVDALRRTGGRNEVLCRSLASLTVQHEEMDAALARGDQVDVDQLVKLSGAISRVIVRAGLMVDDEPSEDGTAAAIAALRAYRETEAA